MKGTVSRRVFVGSVAAALPLVASASGDSLTKAPTGQPHRHSVASEVPDVMYDHATRRVAAILNRVRRNGVTAEDARLMAAHFGTLAIYAQQTDIDGRMTSAIRDLVRAKGHGEVDLEIDVARARAALKRYGVDVDDRWFDVPRPDRRTQEKALDDLSRLGVSGMFARIASRFERTATELDRRGGGVARIKLVQDDSWRTQFCEVLWVQVIAMSAESAAACAAMIFMPQFDAPCVVAQMSYMALLSAYYALCF
jgi:hypothetical protein